MAWPAWHRLSCHAGAWRSRGIRPLTLLLPILLFFTITSASAAAPQPDPIRQAFERLSHDLPYAARQGYPPEWRQAVERAREDALDHTRANRDRIGDYYQWGLPFQYIHAWSLRHGLDSHPEARRAVHDALEVLQTLESEEHVTQAIMVITRIADIYLQRWRESHPLEAIRLLDDIDDWIMAPTTRTTDRLTVRLDIDGRRIERRIKNTAAAKVWTAGIYRHQTFFLENEHLFDPAQRQWLKQSRDIWLRRVASDPNLPVDVSTPVITAWARALYNTGQTDLAERYLLAWQRRHGGDIRDAGFYAMLMAIPLFGRGDWDRADAIRIAVNRNADRIFRTSRDRWEHAMFHRVFYQHLALPGYELRRRRAEQLAGHQHRIVAADEQRREEALKKAHP